jgi:hypothetical protein
MTKVRLPISVGVEPRKNRVAIRKRSASVLERRGFSWTEFSQRFAPGASYTDNRCRNKTANRCALRKIADHGVWLAVSLVAIDLPVRLGQLVGRQGGDGEQIVNSA